MIKKCTFIVMKKRVESLSIIERRSRGGQEKSKKVFHEIERKEQ